jgi:cytochrome c-type biogenesis protein CcmH
MRMHSLHMACEKMEAAGFSKTPQRHSREGGNPSIKLQQALIWVPASAGTTLRRGLQTFQPIRRFFYTLLRGRPAHRAAAYATELLRFARNDVRALIVGLILAFSFAPAFAVDPSEQLKDTKLEARAREISAGLRCLVCQNQSIDDSDAPLARDLRLIVRQQLQKGASNSQVVDYVVARYGEFVLLNPRLNVNTLILWLTPLLLIAGGGVLAARIVRRPQEKSDTPPPLTPEERKELEKLLAQPSAKS